MIKTVTHNGLTCVFSESDHSYTLNTGQVLTSVTTLIKQVTPPFDAPAMAQKMIDKKKPAYAGMTLEEILEQWQKKASWTSYEGTLLHAYAEQWPETKGYGFNPHTPRVLDMCKQVDKLFPKLLKRFRLVVAEKIIFSPNLGIAGTVDLLMADDSTNEGVIIDWKTNSKTLTDSDSSFGNMLSPLEHLPNCDVVKYGLQLAIYEKMLEVEEYYPEFKGYRKALVHVRPGVGKVVKVQNFYSEIKKLLNN